MQINRDILERYFQGNCSEQEQLLVETYLQQAETPTLDNMLHDTYQAANKPKTRIHKLWYGVAAAVATGIILLAGFYKHEPSKQMAQKIDTIFNNTNNVQIYNLPDGSQVWLNAHSMLGYREDYNTNGRNLWLQGVALFKVVSNPKQPFNVHTRHLTTTVLGTTFQISTDNRADGGIQVSLIEGKVSVTGNNGYTKILEPGEMLTSKEDTPPAMAHFDSNEVLDWKNNKIIFNKTTLADVLTRLQQREGLKIVLQDKQLANKKISGEFSARTPVKDVLNSLAYVHNLSCTRVNDSTFLVTGKK
ncbi:FecR family protein [Chitinophaga sp. Hz27]|uniref:FecR family protein n=1 Tax=Chitinophaga sp. Hz27 TaxID=3347169 RepID=UPI0035E011F9